MSLGFSGRESTIYYSKVLRCWAVEDPRDSIISEARASMRNVVDWLRDVLFKDLSALVNTYEKTLNVLPGPDATTPLASQHSFGDGTQTVGFGTQPNFAFGSQEVLETDNESVRESTESAPVDCSSTTQPSSLSSATDAQKKIKITKRK